MSNTLREAGKTILELEETIQQLDAEIQRIDEQTDELLRLTETGRNECSILYERRDCLVKRGFSTSSVEIQRIDDRITEIEQQLDRWEQNRNELLEHRGELISEKEIHLKKINQIKNPNDITGLAKGAVKKAAAAPISIAVQTVKGGVKSTVTKANPFDKKINTNDVTDSGVESIRLAYTSVKKAKNSIKTVKGSIKTTQRTIKTTGKAAKATMKMAYKTPIFIVKATAKVVHITGTIIANVIAFVINPVVIVIAALLLLFIVIAGAVVLLLGGIAGGTTSNAKAQANAAGLGDVPSQYQDALEYFNIAVQDRKDDFYALIDNLYYDYNDLTHSDLVYMKKTDASGNNTIYQTGFATDNRKNTLKSAWNFSDATVREIIAVAYVYLEKQANTANNTENGIYEVTYTQELFNMLVEKCATFNDFIYEGQNCGTGCTRHVEIVDNPAYPIASNAVNTAAYAYNDWAEVAVLIAENNTIRDGSSQTIHWNNRVLPLYNAWIIKYNRYPTTTNNGNDFLEVLGKEYEAAVQELNNTPATIEEITYICEYQHKLHSIGLWYYNKDSVMNALGFTDSEKEWVRLTEMGFENNPDIP